MKCQLKPATWLLTSLAQCGKLNRSLGEWRVRYETGVTIAKPRPTSGTIDGAPKNQTPSRAEHGPGRRFIFKRREARSRKDKNPTRSFAKVRACTICRVPSLLSTFLVGLPSLLDTGANLSKQKIHAHRNSHPLKFGTSLALSSAPPPFFPAGIAFAQTVIRTLEEVVFSELGEPPDLKLFA